MSWRSVAVSILNREVAVDMELPLVLMELFKVSELLELVDVLADMSDSLSVECEVTDPEHT
jgi:hypothetical protein